MTFEYERHGDTSLPLIFLPFMFILQSDHLKELNTLSLVTLWQLPNPLSITGKPDSDIELWVRSCILFHYWGQIMILSFVIFV